ncbi:MAG TPA: alpha/beta hydrolase [Iamia sp.]|nr:alpha/beta hydrolase [Iamia sp.]
MTPAVVHGLPLKAFERLGPADLAVVEAGDPTAPAVVLLHGFPTHSVLWRRVIRRLGDDLHALAPDLLGLGDTVVSPYEDFGAPMQADLLLDWLDKRGIEQAVLVGHEQGGAVAQQIVANHPERVAGLVLVATVAYDNWPIALAAQVMRLARTPGADVLAYALDLPRRVGANDLIGFGRAVYDAQSLDPDVVDEYLRPLLTAEGRERARRFLLAGDDRVTLECIPGLRAYTGPAAVVWGADDAFLSPSWGARLVDDLAGAAALTLVPFCGHLVPEEAPDAVADAVRDVVARG